MEWNKMTGRGKWIRMGKNNGKMGKRGWKKWGEMIQNGEKGKKWGK